MKIIPEINREDIFKITQPSPNGAIDGKKGIPEAGSDQVAETEKRVVFEVENYLKTVADLINMDFTEIARLTEALSLADLKDNFQDTLQESKAEFNGYCVRSFLYHLVDRNPHIPSPCGPLPRSHCSEYRQCHAYLLG